MIIHKKLKTFLSIIYIKNLDFQSISEFELRKEFKNNEYYNLKVFCYQNNLIIIEFNKINLTPIGIELYKVLNTLEKF